VWLIGHSSGTFSAAGVAIKKQKLIAGLVLLSAVTRTSEDRKFLKGVPQGCAGLEPAKIKEADFGRLSQGRRL